MKGLLTIDWRNMLLTDHFSLGEFVVSGRFASLANQIVPKDFQVDNLKILCEWILEPLRIKYGPMTITSGLRSPELSDALGAVAGGQHERGMAADALCRTVSSMHLVYEYVVENLQWPGEVIFYEKLGHVHFGLPEVGVVPDHFIKT